MRTRVSLERQRDVAVLTFACDETGKPATLDLAVLDELATRLTEVRTADSAFRALVIQSNSPRYFIVGADVRALETLDGETIVPWIQRGHEVFDQMERLPLPVVARVEGYALGGGLELAMACDLIVASVDARFGQPEAKLGFVAGWGGTLRLTERVGAPRAKELFFTGRIIDAAEARDIGLVDDTCAAREVDARLEQLLEQIRGCSPLALAEMKRLVNENRAVSLRRSHVREVVASSRCLADPETKTRIRAFLDRRRDSG